MQVVCSHSIQHRVEAAALYELLKLVMLCGWCCCHSCFCWTASCWDWSEVDRRFTRGDTQFAGMIKPVISKESLWGRVQQEALYSARAQRTGTSLPRNQTGASTGLNCSREAPRCVRKCARVHVHAHGRTHTSMYPVLTPSPDAETEMCRTALPI